MEGAMTLKLFVFCVLFAGARSVTVDLAASVQQASTTNATVSGVVHDSTGAVVAGAVVIVRSGGRDTRQTITGPDGHFLVEVDQSGDLVLIVRAGGFAEGHQRTNVGARDLDIVLMPAALFEEITVMPSRTEQRVGDIPASVNVLSREDI